MYPKLKLISFVALFLGFATTPSGLPTQAGTATAQDKPLATYVDKGACPFECCTYRQWIVLKPTAVFNKPNGQAIAHLTKGERVAGLTGEVISKPVAIKADHDIPGTPIKAGNTFYVVDYVGEGGWTVWFRGETITVDETYFTDVPKLQISWWVKIKDARGKIGWALSENNNFGNQDACG